jgi:hypothetical protein
MLLAAAALGLTALSPRAPDVNEAELAVPVDA